MTASKKSDEDVISVIYNDTFKVYYYSYLVALCLTQTENWTQKSQTLLHFYYFEIGGKI